MSVKLKAICADRLSVGSTNICTILKALYSCSLCKQQFVGLRQLQFNYILQFLPLMKFTNWPQSKKEKERERTIALSRNFWAQWIQLLLPIFIGKWQENFRHTTCTQFSYIHDIIIIICLYDLSLSRQPNQHYDFPPSIVRHVELNLIKSRHKFGWHRN